MTFKVQMATDLTAVFFNTSEFADVCSYTPKSTGVAIENVPVLMDAGASLNQTEFGATESDAVMIPMSAIPAPAKGDFFTMTTGDFAGNIYTVRQRGDAKGSVYTIAVETDSRQNPKGS